MFPFPGSVVSGVPYPDRCWAHLNDCDGLCRQDSAHGADFHAHDVAAVDSLGLCEAHRREIVGHRQSVDARFWGKVARGAADECWDWLAARRPSGYGVIGYGGRDPRTGSSRYRYAHRLAWELTRGAIPSGLYVLHHCDNRSCVNPDHLYLGTHADNMRDMAVRGRAGPRRHPERYAGVLNGRYRHGRSMRPHAE